MESGYYFNYTIVLFDLKHKIPIDKLTTATHQTDMIVDEIKFNNKSINK